MRKTAIAAGVLAAGALLAPSALAQTYISGGYSVIEADAVGSDVTVGAVTIRAGHEFNPFFAVEGEASFGVDDDTYTNGGPPVDVSLDNRIGVFAVGRLPVPMLGTVFGRAGYANTEFDDPGNQVDSGHGIAYGGGLEFDLIPGITTRLEYTDYTQTKSQTWGISAGLKF